MTALFQTDDQRVESRARQIERERQARLDLWRIRGRAARAAKAPRQPPRICAVRAADHAAKAAAWLAGYDGAR